MDDCAAFSMLRRAVDEPAFFQRMVADFDSVLIEGGFTDPRDRAEMGRVMAGFVYQTTRSSGAIPGSRQQDTTRATADSFKSGLRGTVDQIERGFRSTMIMYMLAFYLGVVLILASLVMAFVKEKSLIS